MNIVRNNMEENIDDENNNILFENVFEEIEDNVAFTNRRLVCHYRVWKWQL